MSHLSMLIRGTVSTKIRPTQFVIEHPIREWHLGPIPSDNMKFKQIKIRNYIVKEITEKGPQSTTALYESINDHFRNGTTVNCLSNILSKDPQFEKYGMTETASILSGSYKVCVWKISKQ